MTEGEFSRLPHKMRHKIAAKLLRSFHEEKKPCDLNSYRRVERWIGLPFLDENDFPSLADRYHTHIVQAKLPLKEPHFFTHQVDSPSDEPYLPVSIYLDNIRSAFNVGSIVRTTEAFRLGTLLFAGITPFIDNPKVQKTSMCSFDKVPCQKALTIESLPRPLIALETLREAPSIFDFLFPQTFTLILGNEEYGVSKELLETACAVVQIPLYGFKNSLNVASAYAIAAGVISHQLRRKNFNAIHKQPQKLGFLKEPP